MQLTNYSAIDMRHAVANILDNRDHSVRRITTGKRLARASDDPGAISVAAKLDVTNRQRATLRTNLQNAKTFVEMQGITLLKVNDVYDRMSVLAQRALDVTLSDADRADLDVEFQELVTGLNETLDSKFNGLDLFNQNVICGGIQDIDLGQLDYRTSAPGVAQTIRGQSKDVNATGGTLTFSANSGGAGEIYRVFMGNQEVFSSGPSFVGPDPTAPIINRYNAGYGGAKTNEDTIPPALLPTAWGNDSWRTSGSAGSGDPDTFKITFGPTTPTSFEIIYGGSNLNAGGTPGYSTQGQLLADGGVMRIADLSPSSNSTQLSLHFETRTIARIYSKDSVPPYPVTFEPLSEDTELTIGENGETMMIGAKGFDTISGYDIQTAANAQAALIKIMGDESNVGEADCLLYERIGALRAEIARIDERLYKLADDLVQGEAAYGRVVDLDYAREMTHFATNTMQLNVMTSSMANANRATDVLMPLTAHQFKSAVTQRFQLL